MSPPVLTMRFFGPAYAAGSRSVKRGGTRGGRLHCSYGKRFRRANDDTVLAVARRALPLLPLSRYATPTMSSTPTGSDPASEFKLLLRESVAVGRDCAHAIDENRAVLEDVREELKRWSEAKELSNRLEAARQERSDERSSWWRGAVDRCFGSPQAGMVSGAVATTITGLVTACGGWLAYHFFGATLQIPPAPATISASAPVPSSSSSEAPP